VAAPAIERHIVVNGPRTSILFEPVTVGPLQLKNRLVLSPMGTCLDDRGYITDATIAYYRRRAEGGVGTITVEASLVAPECISPEPRIHDREYLPGLRRLVRAVRPYEVTVGIQLLHPGRQVVEGPTVAPSPVPLNSSAPTPRELSQDDLATVVAQYGYAAEIASEAGFDFVEVHGAHGYLLSDFLSPLVNFRSDEYGGTLENRSRLTIDVAREIIARCPADFPLLWRVSGEEALPGGYGINEIVQVCRWLEAAGVAALSVSAGTWRSLETTLPPMFVGRGHLVPLAARVKAEVAIPVMAVGRLDDPAVAAKVIEDGDADLVLLGRGLMADPDWPSKVERGDLLSIRPCIACNACVDLVGRGLPAKCAVNAAVGREHEWSVIPAATPRKVMVIGSGPAGAEAALLAASRGHQVSIWESADELGGKLDVASRAPGKADVLLFRDYQARMIEESGVIVRLGVEVTPGIVELESPDVVVVANGAAPLTPPIPGIDRGNVCDAQLILSGEVEVAPGSTVAVIGGSATGCETAELLAVAGVRVTILEMLPAIGHGIEAITRRYLIRQLRGLGVTIVTSSKVVAIGAGTVTLEASDGSTTELAVDRVALALGWRSRGAALAELLPGREVIVIGDAERPGDFVAAVRAGADVGLAL
jgi:2,4-dienoyl-CoA reductase (NADPH2)